MKSNIVLSAIRDILIVDKDMFMAENFRNGTTKVQINKLKKSLNTIKKEVDIDTEGLYRRICEIELVSFDKNSLEGIISDLVLLNTDILKSINFGRGSATKEQEKRYVVITSRLGKKINLDDTVVRQILGSIF